MVRQLFFVVLLLFFLPDLFFGRQGVNASRFFVADAHLLAAALLGVVVLEKFRELAIGLFHGLFLYGDRPAAA